MKNILSLIALIYFSCSSPENTSSLLPEILHSKIFTDSLFTNGIEGPAIDSSGNLYLVNFHHEGSIGIIKYGDSIPQLFVDLTDSSIGNGIRFDSQNNMYIADYKNHNVLKIDLNTKSISIFAHDSTMNQPNDLAIMKNGILFASDPNWKNNTGKLWRIDKNGSTTLLEDSMGTTNGIEVSPDQKHLYVNESMQHIIWIFDLDKNGNISNKSEFMSLEKISFSNSSDMDGMRCDKNGNLYLARYDYGVIMKISPEGKMLAEIKLHGQKPTNVTFSKDEKKLFVTMQDKKWVEVIDL